MTSDKKGEGGRGGVKKYPKFAGKQYIFCWQRRGSWEVVKKSCGRHIWKPPYTGWLPPPSAAASHMTCCWRDKSYSAVSACPGDTCSLNLSEIWRYITVYAIQMAAGHWRWFCRVGNEDKAGKGPRTRKFRVKGSRGNDRQVAGHDGLRAHRHSFSKAWQ